MNDELHRHLDGELPREGLDTDRQEQADDWDRMVAAFRTSAPQGSAPPWLEQRVMSEIAALPETTPLRRLIAWLLRPTQVRVSPLAAVAVMAVFALVLVLPGRRPGDTPDGLTTQGPESIVYVQFMLEAPTASSVQVAGDFSEWEPTFTLEDTDGDGVWTGRVPVQPGVHTYMFLIDGTEWETDPRADRYQDDGFGNRNAVLAVAGA